MDATALGVVATSLGIAKDIGKAMIGVRDSNLIAEKLSALNDQLLKAQDALLAHNAAMFQLQNEHFQAREDLRKLQEAAAERGRYSLVEIAPGNFAYRAYVAPTQGTPGQPVAPESAHYLCQPCYDNGVKAVLGLEGGGYAPFVQRCPICRHGIQTAPAPLSYSRSMVRSYSPF